jgi:phosphate transport system protein
MPEDDLGKGRVDPRALLGADAAATHAEASGRPRFDHKLSELEARALGGLDLVVAQLDRTLEALSHQDVELSELVIAGDHEVDERYLEVQNAALALLALQAPVAGDLRLVASLLHALRSVERMGDQCVNIAKLIPLSGNRPPVRPGVLKNLIAMGACARSEVVQCRIAFANRDVELAADLVRQDAEINRLNREVFRQAIEIGDEHDVREWAMHMTIVARALERIGDNAVDIGEQVQFLVTGVIGEFSDASSP